MVIKETIEALQEKRIRSSLGKASGDKRKRLERDLGVIQSNRKRRRAVAQARAESRFKSEIAQAREQPAFDEAQRQATQKFKLKTLQSKGRLPAQQKRGALAGLDKFLAGTGVAKGTAPILRGSGKQQKIDILGGGGVFAQGSKTKKRKGGFGL